MKNKMLLLAGMLAAVVMGAVETKAQLLPPPIPPGYAAGGILITVGNPLRRPVAKAEVRVAPGYTDLIFMDPVTKKPLPPGVMPKPQYTNPQGQTTFYYFFRTAGRPIAKFMARAGTKGGEWVGTCGPRAAALIILK